MSTHGLDKIGPSSYAGQPAMIAGTMLQASAPAQHHHMHVEPGYQHCPCIGGTVWAHWQGSKCDQVTSQMHTAVACYNNNTST